MALLSGLLAGLGIKSSSGAKGQMQKQERLTAQAQKDALATQAQVNTEATEYNKQLMRIRQMADQQNAGADPTEMAMNIMPGGGQAASTAARRKQRGFATSMGINV